MKHTKKTTYQPLFERLEDRILLDANPLATLGLPAEHFINEDFSFSIAFENATTNQKTGYGPFIDLTVGAGVKLADGTGNPTYLGHNLPSYLIQEVGTWDGSKWVNSGGSEVEEHPYGIGLIFPKAAGFGDKWLLVQLPFGSFVDNQPKAELSFSATLDETARPAVPGTGLAPLGSVYNIPISVNATGAFRYGHDPLDNAVTDHPIIGATHTDTIIPKVLELTKTSNAHEDETATGRNFPVEYTLNIDIAKDAVIPIPQLVDFLPDNLSHLVINSITVQGTSIGIPATTLEEPTIDPLAIPDKSQHTLPNSDFLFQFAGDIKGTTVKDDIVIKYQIFVPEFKATGTADSDRVIDKISDKEPTSINESYVSATYHSDYPLSPYAGVANGVVVHDGKINTVETDTPTGKPTNTGTSADPVYQDNGNPVADPVDNDPADYSLDDLSIAIQKSGKQITAGNTLPGVVVEYTLNFQISDYFAFKNVVIDDKFSDGQRFDSTFIPKLVINGNETHISANAPFTGSFSGNVNSTFTIGNNIFATVNTGTPGTTDGSTAIKFEVSDELIQRGLDGNLVGNRTPTHTPGTTGTIVYRTIIQEEFTDVHLTPGYTGDKSVDSGDVLDNKVQIKGDLIDQTSKTPLGTSEDDDSSAKVQIAMPTMQKYIYAINGAKVFKVPPRLGAGEIVTYRLTATLPAADTENFKLVEFLPLPVFNVSKPNLLADLFTNQTITQPNYVTTPDYTPPVGVIAYGPSNTLYGAGYAGITSTATPVLTKLPISTDNNPDITIKYDIVDGKPVNNELHISYGNFDTEPTKGAVVDILFTVMASQDPFAHDGFFLTNQAENTFGNTQNSPANVSDIVQILLVRPDIKVSKGTVATTSDSGTFTPALGTLSNFGAIQETVGSSFTGLINPVPSSALATPPSSGGFPSDSNLANSDGGDIVRFAITLENKGGKEAYDLVIKDTLADGYQIPASGLNLYIGRGDETTLLDAIDTPGGSGTKLSASGNAENLFTSGLEIIDLGETDLDNPDSATGAIAKGYDPNNTTGQNYHDDPLIKDDTDENDGSNVIIIMYDLQLKPGVEPGTIHENKAELLSYAVKDDKGINFLNGQASPSFDIAQVKIAEPTIGKVLTTTDQTVTTDSNLTIGEIATYTLTVTLPDGESKNVKITDNIPFGMKYVPNTAVFTQGTFNGEINGKTSGIGIADWTVTNDGSNGGDIIFSALSPVKVTSELGDKVINPSDTGAASSKLNNTFTFTYQAQVIDVYDAVDGAKLANQAKVETATSNSISSDKVEIQLVEPKMEITKDITETAGKAGDTVNITLKVKNVGSSPAFETVVKDYLDPLKFTNVTSSDQNGFLYDFAGNHVIYTAPAGVTINVNGELTFTFTAKLTGDVKAGETLINTARVTEVTTLPGVVAGERNEPSVESTDTVLITAPTYTKVLINTEFDNATINNTRLQGVIGELATYRLTFTVPPGKMSNVVFEDTLDKGLGFVALTSISSTGTITSDAGTPDIPNFTATAITDATELAKLVVVGTITGDGNATNQKIPFNFGNLTNASTTVQTVTLQYQAIVLNTAANQSTAKETGPSLNNMVSIVYNPASEQPASLAGTVFNDQNDSNTQNGSEPGLSGIVVTLKNETTSAVYTLLTDSKGQYKFNGLPPGSYTVSVKDEYMPVNMAAVANNTPITLTAAQNETGVNFALKGNSKIGDTVFFDYDKDKNFDSVKEDIDNDNRLDKKEDLDADNALDFGEDKDGDHHLDVAEDLDNDGRLDGRDVNNNGMLEEKEVGVQSTNVALLWAGRDGKFGTTDDINYGLATTNASGVYDFSALPAGNYKATVQTPATLLTTPQTVEIALTPGTTYTQADFGLVDSNIIGDMVYYDKNNNGAYDSATEAGVAGVTVTAIWDKNNNGIYGDTVGGIADVTYTTTTDNNGHYSFAGLSDGTFRVTATGLAGLTATAPKTITFANPTLITPATHGTQSNLTADFGLQDTANTTKITGTIKATGASATDYLLPLVPVTATWCGADNTLGTADDIALTVNTDATGKYTFNGAPTGQYQISIAPSSTYTIPPAAGTPDPSYSITPIGTLVKTITATATTNTHNFDLTAVEPILNVEKIAIIEPVLTIIKIVDDLSPDAGNIVTFTYTIAHPANSETNAYDVTFEDTLPTKLLTNVTGSGLISALLDGVNVSSNFEWVATNKLQLKTGSLLDIPKDKVLIITVKAKLDTSVIPSEVLNSTATIQWSSLDGNNIDGSPITDRSTYVDNDSERTGTGGINDYTDSDDAPIKIVPLNPTKTIVATSEAHTTGNNVAIGEIIRYRLQMELPESTMNNLQFKDILPDGLKFLNDGTARGVLLHTDTLANMGDNRLGVGVGPNAKDYDNLSTTEIESVIHIPNHQLTDAEVNAFSPNVPLIENFAFSIPNTNPGSDVTFFINTVTNPSNLGKEYAIIEFNAIVTNEIENQSGITRANLFEAHINSALAATSGTVTVTIVEPSVAVTKTITTTPTDAGDTIVYQLVVTNSGNADAFEVIVTDPLDDHIDYQSHTVLPGTLTVTPTVNVTTEDVELKVDKLAAGETATITITGQLKDSIPPAYNLLNKADIIYTSLPGSGSHITTTTDPNYVHESNAGTAGSTTGERTGTVVDTTDPNDYVGSSNISTTLPSPTITKTIDTTNVSNTAGNNVAIGEIVTYHIAVTMPEGTIKGLKVNDDVPVGMKLVGTPKLILDNFAGTVKDVNGVIVIDDGAITYSGGTTSGANIAFSFGDTTATGDGDSTNNTFIIEYQAVVINEAGNVQTDTLQNSADLQFTDPNDPSNDITNITTPADPIVTIVEPKLEITKALSSIIEVQTIAGGFNTFEYTVIVKHNASAQASAYDVVIKDLLTDTNLTLIPNSVTTSGVTATVDKGNTTGDTTVEISLAELKTSETLTIKFQATIPNNLAVGTDIDNTATVTGDSIPGTITDDDEQREQTVDSDVITTVGAIGDQLWLDSDGDGLIDVGEPNLPGVTVELLIGTTVVGSTTTDSDGKYYFPDLPAENYKIRIDTNTLPDGITITNSTTKGTATIAGTGSVGVNNFTVNLTAGQERSDVDFGYKGNGSIGDLIWLDANGLQTQDSNEFGFPNIDVTLKFAGKDGDFATSDDNITYTTKTDADGKYQFTGLPNGKYKVIVDNTDLPAGTTITTTNATTAAQTRVGNEDTSATITLNSTQRVYDTVDFGYKNDGAIGNFVWHDVDADGVQDVDELADKGLIGIDLALWWLGKDGAFGGGDDVKVQTTTTIANGAYEFIGLPYDNNYRVVVDNATIPGGLVTSLGSESKNPAGADVTLTTASHTVVDVDFGYKGSVSIGDFVWVDMIDAANGGTDGTPDAGEPGLPNVKVTIEWAGRDNNIATTGDNLTYVTTTGADGKYLVENLPTGEYKVTVDTDDTTSPNVANLTLTTPGTHSPASALVTNDEYEDADFGFKGDGKIGDYIWRDINGDGLQTGETDQGIAAVKVNLIWAGPDGIAGNGDDIQIASTTTDDNGYYQFEELFYSKYTVKVDRITLPDGMREDANITGDPDAVKDGQHVVTLTNTDKDQQHVDFGYRGIAKVGDFVWNDLDGDGNQDTNEPGLPGIEVQLVWAGPNNTFGDGDDLNYTTTTLADGSYEFTNLSAGLYRASINMTSVPNNMSLTSDAQGTLTDNQHELTLAVGDNYENADFGLQGNSSIGDLVWNDMNLDGDQDIGEIGIPNVNVTITWLGPNGNVEYENVYTDANGHYKLEGLPVGQYQVKVANDILSDVPAFKEVDLAANTYYENADFGFAGLNLVGDYIWHDIDKDGVQEAGEPPLSLVQVKLSWAGLDNDFATTDDNAVYYTLTNESGIYNFAGLLDGKYKVDIQENTAPGGMTITTNNANESAVFSLTTAVNPTTGAKTGEERLDFDFGFAGNASIGDTVWYDINDDGIQNPGEPGIPNVTVTAKWLGRDDTPNTLDDRTYTVQTNSLGIYQFVNMPTGKYQLSVDQTTAPTDLVLTTDTDVSTGSLTDNKHDVTLTSGQNYVNADFGYSGKSSLGDYVWEDVNRDGLQDMGWTDADGDTTQDPGEENEPPIAGVTVNLTWFGLDGTENTADDAFIGSDVTDADGKYQFDDLPAGQFRVTLTNVPAGYVPTVGPESIGAQTTVVTLGNNEDKTNVDFGYGGNKLGTASVGDLVWYDTNDDGNFDAGETVLPDVKVNITWAGPDDIFGTTDDFQASTFTDENGNYLFEYLAAGKHKVVVDTSTLPGGVTTTTPNMTDPFVLGDGEDKLDVDFGYRGMGSMGDTVWFDHDGDGTQDAGEFGLANIPIQITWPGTDGNFNTPQDNLIFNATTDSNGNYLVEELPQGQYQVIVDPTAITALGLTKTVGNSNVTLGANEQKRDVDFGYRGTASLGNYVWHDIANNQQQDIPTTGGDNPLANIALNLTWLGAAGDADDVLIASLNTNSSGLYKFDYLMPGNYQVEVASGVPLGLTGFANSGHSIGITSSGVVTLAAGEERLDVDFGYEGTIPGTASIGDLVWYDTNGDGIKGANEPVLSNITVTLVNPTDNSTLATVTTDINGNYHFTGLPAGDYQVKVDETDLPADVTLTTPNAANTVTLTDGQAIDTVDFGYRIPPGSIGDFIWNDQDGDGNQDTGEPGLAGIPVQVIWAGVDGNPNTTSDNVTYNTVTDNTGRYQITDLPPGNYQINVDPNGTILPAMNLVKTVGDNEITLTTGENKTDVDFGYQGPGQIGDRVWFDTNGNQIQESSELGLPNITITMTTVNNGKTTTYTTTTDENGNYLFTDLPLATYQVTVGAGPANSVSSTPASKTVTLTIGHEIDLDADFGFKQKPPLPVAGTASVGDLVWYDTNNDGQFQTDEPIFPDVTVNLKDINGTVIATTQTDENGNYQFTELVSGYYSVEVIKPLGLALTTPNSDDQFFLLDAEQKEDVDFGYRGAGKVGNFIWNDMDGDGVQDTGEPGLADVTVTAVWAGLDGDLNTTDDNATFTTITDNNGQYQFSNLPAGLVEITVGEGIPAELSPTQGSGSIGLGQTTLTLKPFDNRQDIDFGYTAAPQSSIGDQVWFDTNGNGIFDSGESVLPNVTVTLREAGTDGILNTVDDIITTQQTDNNGRYVFSNLTEGLYQVTPTTPTGSTLTTPNSLNPINLSNNEQIDTVDFGFVGNASLGDYVWYDVNHDGVQDSNEQGLTNVTINAIWAGNDGNINTTADNATFTTQTDATGHYLFEHLPQGSYQVTVNQGIPNGLTPIVGTQSIGLGTANVTLTANENKRDVDFGYIGTASLGDYVWKDTNKDAIQDATELGLANVTVTATWAGSDNNFNTSDDNVTFTTTTDASGHYLFSDLPAGQYQVTVGSGLPVGLAPIEGSQSIGLGTATVSLAAHENKRDVDFGYVNGPQGSIGDLVWYDTNADGFYNINEPILSDVTVTLTSAGNDGQFGTADDITQTQLTDANGHYQFNQLPAGSYQVTPSTPYGLTLTTPSSLNPVNLAENQHIDTIDFGYQGKEQLGDYVWTDSNGDGIQDATETGLANVVVRAIWGGADGNLNTPADNLILTTTTDSDGHYQFTHLSPGLYQVSVINGIPNNLVAVEGNQSIGLGTTTITLPLNSNRQDVDFGYKPLATTGSIGDQVWYDTNENGIFDANEPILADVPVTLTSAGDDGILGTDDDVTQTTITDENGQYQFTDLPAGKYQVTTPVPEGTYLTTPNQPIDLANGEHVDTVDLGYKGGTDLGNYVWLDANGDGIQDSNETGIANATVQITWGGIDNDLSTTNNNISFTTTTDANGHYQFNDIPPGYYQVTVTGVPNNLTPVQGNQSIGLGEATVILPIDGSKQDVDFGYKPTAGSIGDQVWYDTNENGVFDSDEPILADVPVTLREAGNDGILYTSDDVIQTTTTDENGQYQFTDLPAGKYQVTTPVPEGTYLTTPNQPIDLADGEYIDTADLGYKGGTDLGNYIWLDANGDGIQDSNETGIANATVQITWGGIDNDLSTTNNNISFTTTTDANGHYQFNDIPPGYYQVTVTGVPNNLTPVQGNQSIGLGEATVILPIDGSKQDVDFGYKPTAGSIGNQIWYDTNENGVFDSGEPALPNIPVTLREAGADGNLGTADDIIRTTTTDNNGQYQFSGLPAGTYQVTVPTPNGTALTTPNSSNPVTLGSGQHIDTVDFGYTGTAQLGDYVWTDTDGDGIQDSNETGLANVTVQAVWGGADGDLNTTADNIILITTTDATGHYQFNGLPPGAYQVTVISGIPTNLTAVTGAQSIGLGTADVTLAANGNRQDVDFGYTPSGTIGDQVWYDVDGDGIFDPNESVLPNVPVTLREVGNDGVLNTADDIIRTTTTDNNGQYQFSGLPAGTYQVTVPTPDGTALTTPASSNPVTLGSGQHIDTVDFGYTGTAQLGDYVWTDTNGDGVQDGNETGLANVTIQAVWGGADGDLATTADNIILTTTTDATGHYQFNGLPPGSYQVTVISGIPTNLTAVTGAQSIGLGTANVTLAANGNRQDVDFGYTPSATIGDQVWYDVDGDGIFDSNESVLPNIPVTLREAGNDGVLNTADDIIRITTTDNNGQYQFSGLPAGTYQVTVPTPDGTALTTPNSSNPVTLTSGQHIDTVDFGYTGTAQLGDYVWTDIDGDGVQDTNESGLANVTIQAVWGGADGDLATTADNIILTTTTDATGHYQFNSLPPGAYQVTVLNGVPNNLSPVQGAQSIGSGTTTIMLAPSESRQDIDFGYTEQLLGSIGDFVWYDINNNGLFDSGEPALSNMPMTLTIAGIDGLLGTADDVIKTTTTDANGYYAFTHLPAGLYQVSVPTPLGTILTTPNSLLPVQLGKGQQIDTVDFGFSGKGAIGDYVWFDENKNGFADADELGIDNVTLQLIWAGNDGIIGTNDDVSFSTITDSTGYYQFENLPNGNFVVTVDTSTLPKGFGPTIGNTNVHPVTLSPEQHYENADFGYITVPDYVISKDDGVESVKPGDVITYTITVTNAGQVEGTGVVVTDILPSTLLENVTASNDGAVSDDEIIWQFDTLGVGETQILTVSATVKSDIDVKTMLVNRALVVDDNTHGPDPTPENNITDDPDIVIPPGLEDDTPPEDDTVPPTDNEGNPPTDGNPPGTGTNPPNNGNGNPPGTGTNPPTNGNGNPPGTGTNPPTNGNGNPPGTGTNPPTNGNGNPPGTGVNPPTDGNGNPPGTGINPPTNGNGNPPGTGINPPTDGNGNPPGTGINPPTDGNGNPPNTGINPPTDGNGNPPNTGINPPTDDNGNPPSTGINPPNNGIPPIFGDIPPGTTILLLPPEVFTYNSLHDDRPYDRGEIEDIIFGDHRDLEWTLPPLPIAPIYSGSVASGTTLVLTLYDESGSALGSQTVVADVGGNWLASFPSLIIYDTPHSMNIKQLSATYNDNAMSVFDMRTYFVPALTPQLFFSNEVSVNTVLDFAPSAILKAMHDAYSDPLAIKWDDFAQYEFLASSTTTTQATY